MKNALLALMAVGMLCGNAAGQATKYWDINGTTADSSGSASATGAWNGTATNWNTDSTGGAGGAISAWTNGDTAVFSAGTNATGASTITATLIPVAAGITIEEGSITLTGRVDVNTGTVELKAGTLLSQASSGGGTGTGITLLAGGKYAITGNATLRQTNTAANGSFISSVGVIQLSNNAALTLDYSTSNTLSILQTASIISGSGSLIKEGAGVIGFASPSTYSGPTIINAGELRMRGGTNRLPTSGSVTVNAGGIFNLNGSGQNQTIGQLLGNGRVGLANGRLTISGSANSNYTGTIEDTANAGAAGVTTTGGGITKAGTGSLTLTGANTYTGQTVINGGTVYANNTSGSATGSASVAVNAGGTLAGTGSVLGAVTVASGGTLAPGASVESLATGSLTFGGGSNLNIELDSSELLAAAADLVDATGSLTIDATANLNLSDIAGVSQTLAPGTKFTLVRYDLGTWNSIAFAGKADDTVVTVGANMFVIDYNDTLAGVNFGGGAAAGNYLTLTVAAVPEASAFLFGGLVCCAAGVRRYVRRRRAGSATAAA